MRILRKDYLNILWTNTKTIISVRGEIMKKNNLNIGKSGSYIQSLSREEHDKKLRTFHMKNTEEMNYTCKECKKIISAHNNDWHDGMCDNCFNKNYFPDDPLDPKFSKGSCRNCKQPFSQRAMKKHLQTCLKDTGVIDSFLIRASAGPFFIYLTIPRNKPLSFLDHFLRDVWLECCGHLSRFIINKISYMSDDELEEDEKSMLTKMFAILKPGLKFTYEYDFGTTTMLELECISAIKTNTEKPVIIARNNLPRIKCMDCKNPAEVICTYCIYSGDCFLCKKCAKKHKCEEPDFLPIVNSPRMGMCGYTGE